MITATTATRQNRDGDPCPPWCATDHGSADTALISTHVGDCAGIGFGPQGWDSIWAAPMRTERQARPFVVVTGHRFRKPGSPQVQVPALHAGDLASLVEMLADATPEQHRELAAAIRKAAAAVTEAALEAGDGQAEADEPEDGNA